MEVNQEAQEAQEVEVEVVVVESLVQSSVVQAPIAPNSLVLNQVTPNPMVTNPVVANPIIPNPLSQNPTIQSSSPNASATGASIQPPVEPQLSDYLNYRDFLRAFYLYKREVTKNHLRPYNYSFFSVAADIKSPNYLRLVIEGQRNLSEEMALKFAKAMQLNKESSEEFLLLVLYCQETDPSLRNQYLKNLSDFRFQKSLKHGVLDKKTVDRIPNWIGWILFSLLDQEGAQFSVPQLKQLLRNKASEVEIQTALDKLIESGEIIFHAETGEVKKGRSLIDNPEEIPVVLIRRLQTQLMYMGLESLLQDSPVEREFGTLTLALTKSEYEDLRFQLRKFRKQIHKDNSINRMKTKGERVYQMNLQLYPVTERSQIISDLNSDSDSK